jgi:predicted RNA polymerase sigma factor
MREILERKIGELPEALRVVLVLRSVEELSVEEVAEALSIPQEMVRTRHFRAKAKLREALAREVDLAEGSVYEFGGTTCNELVASVLAAIEAATTSPREDI